MRVLFDHSSPFLLAHGGLQTQIEQTKRALETLGIEVEFLRWWDESQRGDIIHYFGRPTGLYVRAAQSKGIKVVLTDLLTGTGSRSGSALRLQQAIISVSRKVLPAQFQARMGWETYQLADAIIALTAWEAELMSSLFNAPAQRTHVVPNGVEEIFFEAPATPRTEWLVCTATITVRKRVRELAEAAVLAKTPIWFIGRPYADDDSYARAFLDFAKSAPEIIRYEGAISDRAKLAAIYRAARGFVLLSAMESLSLSALEAAACESPLLLTDLPWARSSFGEQAMYCPIADLRTTAHRLRSFYEAAPRVAIPSKPASWTEVAVQLQNTYRDVLETAGKSSQDTAAYKRARTS